ncbi:MAG: hypothetical protein HQM11_15835 [SAR324 cluster bacterium]|nr:hypothetical protein [SAR324 cluster bacterium]
MRLFSTPLITIFIVLTGILNLRSGVLLAAESVQCHAVAETDFPQQLEQLRNEQGLPVSWEEYQRQTSKTILELQPVRQTQTLAINTVEGKQGTATLINLNPVINIWFVLKLKWNDDSIQEYHLENPFPKKQLFKLLAANPPEFQFQTASQQCSCDLWNSASGSELANAIKRNRAYEGLCGNNVYLRNKTEGNKTNLEIVTDWLRNNVWAGEEIVRFVKNQFYQDAFLQTSKVIESQAGELVSIVPSGPLPPKINPDYQGYLLNAPERGLRLSAMTGSELLVGAWYPVQDLPGVFLSVVQPQLVAQDILEKQKKLTNPLDEIENEALVYMVAFDLNQLEMGFAMGTEHPRVDWSERVQDEVLERSLPGPDGIATVAPLAMTGRVPPYRVKQTVATFIGGFKRLHGAFKWGELAKTNHGHHYGFIENGVILSKLQPSLATVVVYNNGQVALKTWTAREDQFLPTIRHARQNGVPLIDQDATGNIKPGAYVKNWGQGNWSGSAEQRFRTLRAGLGFQPNKGKGFLLYGLFTGATTSALARVFEAYQVNYAMQLDINALEHTYLAVYPLKDGQFEVQHLIKGMDVLDKSHKGQTVPRFIGFSDNRDFFYMFRKTVSP